MRGVADPGGTVLFVGLLQDNVHHALKLAGTRRFARIQGWDVQVVPLPGLDAGVSRAEASRAGIVGCIVDCSLLEKQLPPAAFGGVPVVYVDPVRRYRGDAAVYCDSAALVRMAWRELSSGMPSAYAVATYRKRRTWARERVEAFVRKCREEGAPCHVLPERQDETARARAARIERWVAALPPHVAVFCVNDYTAEEVKTALGRCKRPIPRSATLLGVDGIETVAEHDYGGISSIRLDFERTGFVAARLLARLVSAKAEAGSRRLGPMSERFGPLLVVRRESTRGRGRRDARVAEAVEAIRREACDGLAAADLAARFPCSRNLFERRFREAMGHSVLDEILHVRVETAQSLLARPGMTVAAAADLCGFRSTRELLNVFRARTGMSPRQWRKAHVG